MKKRLISPDSKFICDICGTEIIEDMESFENDEGIDFCEECWHEENDHAQCDECGEWITDEENAYRDGEDDKIFCNQERQISYYSAYISHMAGILKDEKYEKGEK